MKEFLINIVIKKQRTSVFKIKKKISLFAINSDKEIDHQLLNPNKKALDDQLLNPSNKVLSVLLYTSTGCSDFSLTSCNLIS